MTLLLWARFVFLALCGMLVASFGVSAWRTKDGR